MASTSNSTTTTTTTPDVRKRKRKIKTFDDREQVLQQARKRRKPQIVGYEFRIGHVSERIPESWDGIESHLPN